MKKNDGFSISDDSFRPGTSQEVAKTSSRRNSGKNSGRFGVGFDFERNHVGKGLQLLPAPNHPLEKPSIHPVRRSEATERGNEPFGGADDRFANGGPKTQPRKCISSTQLVGKTATNMSATMVAKSSDFSAASFAAISSTTSSGRASHIISLTSIPSERATVVANDRDGTHTLQTNLSSSKKRSFSRSCILDQSPTRHAATTTIATPTKRLRAYDVCVRGEEECPIVSTKSTSDGRASCKVEGLVTTTDHSRIHSRSAFGDFFRSTQGESPEKCHLRMERTSEGFLGPRPTHDLPASTCQSGSVLRLSPSRSYPHQSFPTREVTSGGNSNRQRHQATSSCLSERLLQAITTRDAPGILPGAAGGDPHSCRAPIGGHQGVRLIETNKVVEDNSLRSSTDSKAYDGRRRSVERLSSSVPASEINSNSSSTASTPSDRYNFRTNERRLRESFLQSNVPLNWTDIRLLQSVLQVENARTYISIPSYVRERVAVVYTRLLTQITDNPDSIQAWIELLLFPRAVLLCWPMGDPRYKLSLRKRQRAECECILTALQAWGENQSESRDKLIREILTIPPPAPRPAYSEAQARRRCLKLVREVGQYGKAVQALTSHGVANSNEATIKILRSKHPQGPPPQFPRDKLDTTVPFSVDKEEVFEALTSFPKGTACGRSGLRVSHLLEMSSSPNFLHNLTSVVNIMAAGLAPHALAPLLASAPLAPLLKKDGGIRPVAIGEVLRRLVSKLALTKVRHKAATMLSPLQVGVGVPHGAEAIIHGLNRAIRDKDHITQDSTLVLVDLENAFNMVSRQAFIDAIYQYFPALTQWVLYTYGCEAVLFCGSEIISASCGVQQGDPLGPLLFCLVLQPLLQRLSKLNEVDMPPPQVVSYLDDITILAPSLQSAKLCLQIIRDEGDALGLYISPKKSLLWQPSGSLAEYDLRHYFHGLAEPHCGLGIPLLGGSITTDKDYASEVALARVKKCEQSIHALRHLNDDPQVCLLLLRACMGMVKLNYCWRTTSPLFLDKASAVMTKVLQDALRRIVVNNVTKFGDFQLQLSSLPLRLGGLGITLPTDLLHYAYISSSRDSSALQSKIFPILCDNSESLQQFLQNYISCLSPSLKNKFTFSNVDQLPLYNNQRLLAAFYFSSKHNILMGHPYLQRADYQQFVTQFKLILQSTSARHNTLASQWLLAMPNPGLGQVMNADEFRAALGLRLLIPFSKQLQACPNGNCGHTLDMFGYHALSCISTNSQTFARHKVVQKALYDFAHVADYNPIQDAHVYCLGWTERGGIRRQRPADLLVDGHDSNVRTCVDVTVVSPLSASKSRTKDGTEVGYLVKKAARDKREKHEGPCNLAAYDFLPFAVDVCGIVESSGSLLLRRFATRYSTRLSLPYSYALSLCRRRISLAIQLGVARQLRPSLFLSPGKPDSHYWDLNNVS